jgi:hypothetical protein
MLNNPAAIDNYISKDGTSWKWNTKKDVKLYAWWISKEAESKEFPIVIADKENIVPDYFDKVNKVTKYEDINNSQTPFKVYIGDDVKPVTVPERAGYTFDGYYDSLEGGTKIYGSDGNIVAANVKSDKYGWIVKNNKWNPSYGIVQTLFDFYEGMLLGDASSIYTSMEDANGSVINLYAHWTPVKYTINYKVNGGDGADVIKTDVDISNGYPNPVSITNQKKAAQALVGYATTADNAENKLIYKASKDDKTVFEAVTDNITTRPTETTIDVYAIWEKATYQVAYYDRDWNTLNETNAEGNTITVDNISSS